jgi:hypothetical protein
MTFRNNNTPTNPIEGRSFRSTGLLWQRLTAHVSDAKVGHPDFPPDATASPLVRIEARRVDHVSLMLAFGDQVNAIVRRQ